MSGKQTYRLNLRVSQKVRDRLEKLLARSEAESMSDVVRTALAIYDEILGMQEEGGRLYLETSDGERARVRIR